MAELNKEAKQEYEILRQGSEEVMKIDYSKSTFTASLEGDADVMAKTIDKLIEVPSVSRIILNQRKNYEYDFEQTSMLKELSSLYNYLIRQRKILGYINSGPDQECQQCYPEGYGELRYVVYNMIKGDPIGAYVQVKRLMRQERIAMDKENDRLVRCRQRYLNLLSYLFELLGRLKIVQEVKDNLDGHVIGDREIYSLVLRPSITPNFMFTKLMSEPPKNGIELDAYSVKGNDIVIYKIPGEVKNMYHITPPEFKISEDRYMLLDLARSVLAKYEPRAEEFTDPSRMRRTFYNIGMDLLQELADNKGIEISLDELKELSNILVRYTVGFGLIEILLNDDKIQDVVVNSPIGQTNAFIVHQDYDECVTNIIPAREDGDSWATKFRLLSGRPLDEANPVLDTELTLENARARASIMTRPLNPLGLSFSFRRHRDTPWTLPLFIKAGMINPLAAGLMSYFIDGARTMLIAGTRGSGKTSLLDASLLEIMRKFRIITIEDTLELSTRRLRELGYNLQTMKVRAALMSGGTEVAADEGIRTSLRMGDSCLIVGEVRSSIRGNEEVVIINDGITKRLPIKDLEGKDLSNCLVPTLGFDLKMKLSKLTGFVKHPPRNKLLRIKTRTGREVTVTHDHSLFVSTKDFKVSPVECKDLKIGDQVVIPASIPYGYNDIDFLNIMDILPDFRLINFEDYVRQSISRLGWKQATNICNINSGDIYNYFRSQKTNIPIINFRSLMNAASVEWSPSILFVTKGTSVPIPAVLPMTGDLCRLFGYYVSEGYSSDIKNREGGRVVITNSDNRILDDVKRLSLNIFGIKPSLKEVHGLGKAVQVHLVSKPLATLVDRLGFGRTCKEKRIPSFVYGLSKQKIAQFLRGMYSGDGGFTSSIKSGNCVRYFTTSKRLAEDLMYLLLTFNIVARLRFVKAKKTSYSDLWIVEFKDRGMVETFLNKIGFVNKNPTILKKAWQHTRTSTVYFDKSLLRLHLKKYPRKFRHLFRFSRCSKNYLEKVVSSKECDVSDDLRTFGLGEFFLDEIKEIEEINLSMPEPVYDLSVEPSQNFVGGFGGILLHNTEASALFESMRVGALSNVVAGTIHGGSPYAVFDRVVNDLKVPRTSFKATDIIIVANPIRSADGLKKYRRVTQITEVRKNWENDPEKEHGFVDLMRYNVKTDQLEPTDELINGDSEVIKAIAGNVKEWAGDWDAVWENILLRAKIKQKLVDYAIKLKRDDILEADFVAKNNDIFHELINDVRETQGKLDNKLVFKKWDEWIRAFLKESSQRTEKK